MCEREVQSQIAVRPPKESKARLAYAQTGENMSRLSVAIVMTNYNTWETHSNAAFNIVIAMTKENFDTLLVYDDCSRAKFEGSFPDTTRLYRGSPNVGLTKALNIAFGLISEDIVVLFDSDAYPTTPFCVDVKKMFETNPSLGLIGFQTIGRAGHSTESYTSEPNIWSLLLGQALYAKTERWLADKSERLSVFTCAMAVRKTAFLELNGFDENFDWLDLDHDFSMRMNRSRWKVEVAGGPRIFHEGGGTPQLTRNRVLRFYKSRWYLLRKFNRMPAEKLMKVIIVLRLCTEYAALLLLGPMFIPDKVVREDKIQGRRELIEFCFSNY
jgi:GT2 family glycosyltransferase